VVNNYWLLCEFVWQQV